MRVLLQVCSRPMLQPANGRVTDAELRQRGQSRRKVARGDKEPERAVCVGQQDETIFFVNVLVKGYVRGTPLCPRLIFHLVKVTRAGETFQAIERVTYFSPAVPEIEVQNRIHCRTSVGCFPFSM